MKAQKRVRWLQGYKVAGLRSCGVMGLCFAFCSIGAGQSFSEGKNLHQLEEAVCPVMRVKGIPAPLFIVKNYFRSTAATSGLVGATLPNPPSPLPYQPFLPRWSAECLPFFCKIEHDFAQKSALPVKFRLGSVEYVDWLEGKGDDWGH